MKDYFAFVQEMRDTLTERLAIEDNPNAFTPPSERYTPSAADRAFDRRQRRLYGDTMAKIAAQMLARAQRKAAAGSKPRREPYPWKGNSSVPGWWHPQRQWFTFSHSEDMQYHVTQIVKNPKAFGITTAELNAALAKEAAHRNALGMKYYDKDGSDYPYDEDFVRAGILKGDIDLAYEVQRLAYMKGWLKVYSGAKIGGSPTLEGINRDSIRAALREINDKPQTSLDDSGRPVEVIYVGLTRATEVYKWMKPSDWSKA